MIEVKILNSPVASNQKFRYFSIVTYFTGVSVAGNYVVTDSERIILNDAPIFYLLRSRIGIKNYETVLGKIYSNYQTTWSIDGALGGGIGSAMKPRIVTPGSGNFQYNYNGLILGGPTNQPQDFIFPDGTGLMIQQSGGLLLTYEARTGTAFTATEITFKSTLTLLCAAPI